jgi:hypothetical protein
MSNIQFDDATLSRIKLFYQEEYTKALSRALELRKVLEQMDGVETEDVLSGQADLANNVISIGANSAEEKPKKAKKKSNAGRKKKRGPKPVWSNFIMRRLKSTQTPLTYDDMTNHAIAIKNISPQDFDKTRTSIVSAAFRLRNREDRIDTHAEKGDRTKYMGLKDWFEREGKLKEEWRSKIIAE